MRTPTEHETPRFCSARQAGEVFGVSYPTVNRWIADGTLPSIKIAGRRLIAVATIEKLVADATAQAVAK